VDAKRHHYPEKLARDGRLEPQQPDSALFLLTKRQQVAFFVDGSAPLIRLRDFKRDRAVADWAL